MNRSFLTANKPRRPPLTGSSDWTRGVTESERCARLHPTAEVISQNPRHEHQVTSVFHKKLVCLLFIISASKHNSQSLGLSSASSTSLEKQLFCVFENFVSQPTFFHGQHLLPLSHAADFITSYLPAHKELAENQHVLFSVHLLFLFQRIDEHIL